MCVLTRLDTRYEGISEDVFRLRAGHSVCVFRGFYVNHIIYISYLILLSILHRI